MGDDVDDAVEVGGAESGGDGGAFWRASSPLGKRMLFCWRTGGMKKQRHWLTHGIKRLWQKLGSRGDLISGLYGLLGYR